MIMSWTAVTFFTPEYEQYVVPWKASIEALGGMPLAMPMASTGDWAKNTGLKPRAILESVPKITTPWFIYTDVDTLLTEVPVPPTERWDVAVTENLVLAHHNRISAAVIMFNRTGGATAFIQQWKLFCRQRPGKDHGLLIQTINAFRRNRRATVVDHKICWTPNGLRAEEQDALPAKLDPESPESRHVILFKYPSRERPKLFFRSLDSIVENLTNKLDYHVACTLDEDDKSMNCPEVRERLASYKNLSVQWGRSISKIHAVNRDMPDIPWDILVCMSDDMVFTKAGFDDQIRAEMAKAFPFNDGLLHFPDQNAKEKLATMYIAGRGFYDRFGYIYDPDFLSFWCDNLVQDIAVKIGKYKFVDQRILDHMHPAYRHSASDGLYRKNDKFWDHDKALYEQMVGSGLGVPSECLSRLNCSTEIPVWSICIPTVKGRFSKFSKLQKHVFDQAAGKPVEIICLHDDKEMSVGRKRQMLLEQCSGTWVSMIDDDDWVADNYVEAILQVLRSADPDCVGFEIECTGTKGKTAATSLKYSDWKSDFDGYDYVRSPYQKTPTRLKAALAVGYKDLRFGEDYDYSQRLSLSGLLKRETFIPEVLYQYRFTNENHSTKYGLDK